MTLLLPDEGFWCRCLSSTTSFLSDTATLLCASPDTHSCREWGLGNLQNTLGPRPNFPLSNTHSLHDKPSIVVFSGSNTSPSELNTFSISFRHASLTLTAANGVKTPSLRRRRLQLASSRTCGDGWKRVVESMSVTTHSRSGLLRYFSISCLK